MRTPMPLVQSSDKYLCRICGSSADNVTPGKRKIKAPQAAKTCSGSRRGSVACSWWYFCELCSTSVKQSSPIPLHSPSTLFIAVLKNINLENYYKTTTYTYWTIFLTIFSLYFLRHISAKTKVQRTIAQLRIAWHVHKYFVTVTQCMKNV